MSPDTIIQEGGNPDHPRHSPASGVAHLRLRLYCRAETRRHAAGRFHPRPAAPETQRTFDAYEQNSAYDTSGQLQSQTFSDPQQNRDYSYSDSGQLVRISGTYQEEDYRYDGAGRLISTRHHSQLRRYITDPAGNRVADREQYPSLPARWQGNRISEDAEFFYHHDEHGRRKKMSAASATAAATVTVIATITSTGGCITVVNNRKRYCGKVVMSVTRWGAVSVNGSGQEKSV
jgi:YD repeat-containing protein